MGAAIAGVIAASSARASEDLLERFRVADATAPDRAQPLSQLGVTTGTAWLFKYAKAGVICQGRGDRYYLDESAYALYRRRQNRFAVVIGLAAGAIALAAGIAATFVARPHR